MVYFYEKKVDIRGRDFIRVTDKKSFNHGEILGEPVSTRNHNLRFGTIYPKKNELDPNLQKDDEIANYIITDKPVQGFDNLFHTERCVD